MKPTAGQDESAGKATRYDDTREKAKSVKSMSYPWAPLPFVQLTRAKHRWNPIDTAHPDRHDVVRRIGRWFGM